MRNECLLVRRQSSQQWDGGIIRSQTLTVQPLKFGTGYVISSCALLDMWLLIHTGIEVKQLRP